MKVNNDKNKKDLEKSAVGSVQSPVEDVLAKYEHLKGKFAK
jgi:hypothetical protein